jgi:NAD+ synthase (glutamine-hydrolysing)
MMQHGFLRVAAACPVLRIGDCAFNVARTLEVMSRAAGDGVAVLVFPELGLTGYTCADLFAQPVLLRAARAALVELARASVRAFPGIAIVGLPLVVDDQVFNCAAVLHRGRILGLVPKSYLPTYKEFYEARWFAPAAQARSDAVSLADQRVPFGPGNLFAATDVEGLILGVEICEDLWGPVPPSSLQAQAGATVLINVSASNEIIGKAGYRKSLVVSQSGRCVAAYVYSSCGVHESTTDLVFGGHCLIAENGVLLEESPRFQREATLTVADVDLERLRVDRTRTTSFGEGNLYTGDAHTFERVEFKLGPDEFRRPEDDLRRRVEAHPFVPRGQDQLRERCEEIFQIQVAGLARRLEQIGKPAVSIGISGGLDSTLALLVACKTMDTLGCPRSRIQALTMPGFGTSGRTRSNALTLMRELGVTSREIDIRPLCLEEMRALGHAPFGVSLAGENLESLTAKLCNLPPDVPEDLIFQNIQARMRTQLLMNSGFVIGTGDVSELALGWCTYNADHMSMYNPNVSIPKTLVKFLVVWAAENEFDGVVRQTLRNIADTPISPELMPTDAAGNSMQSTEGAIGPYELHDFFLFHFLRYSAPPAKILFLARHATFSRPYPEVEVRKWLGVFLRRFFGNQFKRSVLPDGPKVGSVSLSPRGDWRMPSDAQVTGWLRNLEEQLPRND